MRTMIARLFPILFAAAQFPAVAEDIDLFAAPAPSATALPNVLIVLDNTANWSTVFPAEMAALRAVFNSLPADRFRVGLMLYSETGSGNPAPGGAYVRAALRNMSAANKAVYANLIASLDSNADKGNGRSLGLAMAEAYRYYSHATVYSGIKKKRDHAGNGAGSDASGHVYALPGNALASAGATTYSSPVTDNCQKNFIVYIGNTTAGGNVTQDNTADNGASGTMLGAAGGATTQIPISPTGFSDNYANEWTRFMKASSYGISTYVIDVSLGNNGNAAANTALLKSMAVEGAGKYFYVDGNAASVGSDIQTAMNTIFSEVQSVNSVFASVSLPVSVNTQGSYLNQVYIGMFRPNPDAAPRWTGNLKQYKLGQVGADLKLLDATNTSAINNLTGFIAECARSYWTPSAVDTYWQFTGWPDGTTFCIPTGGNSDSYRNSNAPDGNVVEKGAQAYTLRGTTGRTLKTCGATMAGCTSLVGFDSTHVSATALGAASTTERDGLINWATGLDVDDENVNGITAAEKRPSVHGDVVHSRPVAVNFGSDSAPQVVVFYGGNDGVLRAVNGNRSSAIGGVGAGEELWSFMPPEAYANVKRLRDNAIPVRYPTGVYGTSTVAAPKPYGLDGPITAFRGPGNTFIYAAMRRGGRSVYAFDVSNSLTAPAAPALKWRLGCSGTADTDCSAGFTGIGQTWSSLKAFTTAGYGSGGSPLLVFGGGYDRCEDHDALVAGGANHNCGGTSKGHFVYVVDADTGTLVKSFDTGGSRGVIADVTLVRDGGGQVIYGYTADLGGNVYRITFTGASSAWSMTKIASLGCSGPSACTANRKFMFAPSVVALADGYGILIGSGDREKPLTFYRAASAVSNYFFMFFDKPALPSGTTGGTWPGNTTCGSAVLCLDSLFPIAGSTTPSATQLATKQGWFLGLSSTEQVVTSAVTIFGVVTFSTHQPAVPTPASCSSSLGNTRVYNINYTDAGSADGTDSRFEDVAGDGLPPSPVAGQVTLDNGQTLPFCIGCSKDSPLEGRLPKSMSAAIQPKSRLYWYLQK